MSDISTVQGWAAQVQSTMASLGSAIAAAAPNGDFASILTQAMSVLDPASSSAGSSSSAASSTSTSSGSSGGSLGANDTLTTPGNGTGSLNGATSLSAASSTSGASSTTGASSTSGALATGASGGASAATGTLGSTMSGSLSSSTTGATVVATAEKYLGVPYVWGGATPSGFDCSGFTQYVFGQLGIALPRTSEEQATTGVAVNSIADAQPGDLVFYAGSDGTASAPGHVGIYLGDGEMIDAPQTGENVSITPVGDPVAIRRVVTDPGVAPATSVNASGQSMTVLSDASTSTVPGSTSPVGTGTQGVAVPSSLAPLFSAAAAQYGVPVTLLAAVAQQESGFDTSAVSSAGAEGVMQILPSTAAGLGIDPFNPQQAISGAAQLLSNYLNQYKSTPLALAAYNAGPAAVAKYDGVPPYAETQSYVQDVMSIAGISS